MDKIASFFADYLQYLQGNWISVSLSIGVLVVWLWSGCLAASIAEVRMRSIPVHFFLGLVLPIVYPIAILVKLPSAEAPIGRADREKKYEKVEGPPPVETPPPTMENAPPALLDSSMLDKPTVIFDQNYFKKIAVDMSGNYRGPFLLTVNGEKLKSERIIDSLPNVVLVEFMSGDGKLQNMRIPYKNIGACQEL